MFETAELGRAVGKKEFNKRAPEVRYELLELQRQLAESALFPVLIIIGGVDGAGKGDTVNLLHEWMDARGLRATAFGPRTEDERERPPFWRHWMAMPEKGRIGIFFGSWYTNPILDRVYGRSDDRELAIGLDRINAHEKALVDDGVLIIKFWFHLSKKGQKKRLKRLESDEKTRWRVAKKDWEHFALYDDFRAISEHALRHTSTGEAPWTVVEGEDHNYRSLAVADHLITMIRHRLAQPPAAASPPPPPSTPADPLTVLDKLDVSKTISKKKYWTELERLQGRLNRLSRKAGERRVGAIAVFEGWDAGGKGGAIRRMTAALDARYYRVIPVAAPTDEEKSHHYLWRFWRHLPRLGHLTIYDRSWYGRVLVERVEGFARVDEWKRAYKEINDFEEQLTDFGIVLCKFWLHISPDEQLRRFKEREKIPHKQHKITEEDYRNREKWRLYEAAADEMVARTSTASAPWTLVEANHKQLARIKVLETMCDALEAAVKRAKKKGD